MRKKGIYLLMIVVRSVMIITISLMLTLTQKQNSLMVLLVQEVLTLILIFQNQMIRLQKLINIMKIMKSAVTKECL